MGATTSKQIKAEVFGSSSMDDKGYRTFLLKYNINGSSIITNLPLAPDIDKESVNTFRQGMAMGKLYQLEDHLIYDKNNYSIRILDGHLRIKLSETVYELNLSKNGDIAQEYLEFLINS